MRHYSQLAVLLILLIQDTGVLGTSCYLHKPAWAKLIVLKETLGVPVVTYGDTYNFPAFFCGESDFEVSRYSSSS